MIQPRSLLATLLAGSLALVLVTPTFAETARRPSDNAKEQSSEIQVALSQSKAAQADLDKQREVYRSIATTGSVLFFLVSQVALEQCV